MYKRQINAMLSEILSIRGLTNFTPHHGSVTRLHADDAGQLRVLGINEMPHITRVATDASECCCDRNTAQESGGVW